MSHATAKNSRPSSRLVRPRHRAEETQILKRIEAWAGGPKKAQDWYRSFAIPAFGDRTAEALVKSGEADAVRDYLDAVATGTFQ
ncbi:hypothetical protein M2319_003890 [Rhodobium gokarnense]|uniref:Antitoxin Xre/MbcA/ParS-like toxin-binding domain-containing protein n=1 Tax=Rhodobium gokarnense TaxID=364296 RepID=A0ABT3HGL3_9HYPH|nr:MbcA/ParS/Xre antitoxin family protein [Rhodobium gokarnense]MCW2309534.1 hypothetical protein [Rhodobium gokarnense]